MENERKQDNPKAGGCGQEKDLFKRGSGNSCDESDKRQHPATIRYIDLFAGVGGFRLGIERAINNRLIQQEDSQRQVSDSNRTTPQHSKGFGAKCVFTSEIDKYAIQTYNKNFGTNLEPNDITTQDADSIPDFDLLCGGYPCQSFSIAGKRKGFADTRGTMFFEIERIVKAKQPKFILLENVKGILSHDKGNTWKTITQHLNSLGYLVDYRILNSKYFGVPQNRERVFHIGYSLKWMIKESIKDGQIKRNSQLDKMLKGWILENLLKDLEEVKKLPELKLKEWVLNYLRYICGNQTRLEYSKTIKDSQINNSQKLLKEPQLQLPTREENSDLTLKEKEKSLKMVQDIYESMMKKGVDCGFIELWQKNISEILEKNSQSTISTLIKKIIERETFSCAEINLIIGLFILQQKDYWENWLSQELSDLIKLTEFIQHEGRRNKTKLRERYLLRNIRTAMGFTESSDEPRNFIIGSLRGEPRPEILPFGECNGEAKELVYHQKSDREIARIYDPNGIAPTLHLKTGGWQEPKIVQPVLTPDRPEKRQHGRRFKEDGEPSFTLTGQDVHGVCMGTITEALGTRQGSSKEFLSSVEKIKKETMQIRRLTPIECERLQSFPDNWTEGVSDTQRYKQMGNAVTVNVIEAIIRKWFALHDSRDVLHKESGK